MKYYEVFVSESRYQKLVPLTYAFPQNLAAGSLVSVPYGNKHTCGFVVRSVPKPSFAVKQIEKALPLPPLPAAALALHQWMLAYYPGPSGAATQLIVPSGLDKIPGEQRPDTKHTPTWEPPALTPEQTTALQTIKKSKHRTFLLHGETGSGKTRLYLELARESLAAGRSALILVPEISLVPQLAGTFRQVFGRQVVTLHSGLTKTARLKSWLNILHSEQPLVVIGARSALFAPIKQIGLIAVDEMHEPAYKQESAPRYQSLRAAAAAAKIHGARIVYGSATPSVVEYYIAQSTKVPILRLSSTAIPSGKVKKTIVDLRDKNAFSRHPHLSDQLLKAIEQRLLDHQQTLLFLNRRGTARQVLCQQCGWQAVCPRCDIPLTYHGDDHSLRCHTCGYRSQPPFACPQCGSSDLLYRSLGTKALAEALRGLFPQANIARFDTDNPAAEKLIRNFRPVQSGEVDILVGTQMLGKGLDLPKLSLVGIVNADTGLSMPDFSSAERSYQLLHQALGRVGRGHLHGEVVVQSFNPSHPLLVAALNQAWISLYKQELAERQKFLFPPFCFLLKINVSRKSSQAAEAFTSKLHQQLKSMGLKLQIHAPAPGFYERSYGKHNWQLVIKSKHRPELIAAIRQLPPGDYTYDLDPSNLL